jgi:hypothetical protein
MIFGTLRNNLEYQSSTRAIAIIRIGLVFLLWNRYSSSFLLYKNIPFVQISIGGIFFISSLFVLVGFHTRLWLGVLACTMVLVYYFLGFVVGVEPLTHHHTYLLCIATVFLSFTPCGRSLSLDRYLLVKKSMKKGIPIPQEKGALWATYLIGLQISSIYIWSTYSKLIPGFISGERMEQIFKFYLCNFDFTESAYFSQVMFILAISTIVLELFLAIGLWFTRIHALVMPVGIIFHLILFYFLPVSTFSLTMILLYLVFIPPEKIHTFVDNLFGRDTKEKGY